jgi:hypothetical protein
MSYGFPDQRSQVEVPQPPGRGPGIMLLTLLAVGVLFFMNSARRPPTTSPLEPADNGSVPRDGWYFDDPPEGTVTAEEPHRDSSTSRTPRADRADWSMEQVGGQPRQNDEVELKLQDQSGTSSGKSKSGDWELDTRPDDGKSENQPSGGGG